MPLEYLFDAELTYRAGMAPLAEHGEGQLVGSGDGSVHGQRVRGARSRTLFEGPGEVVCTMNPTLGIRTDDGASIGIEGRGYAHRASRASQRWRVAATLLFSANEGSYAWLDGALGVWEGEFDAGPHSARYRAFVQAPADRIASDRPDRLGDVTGNPHYRHHRCPARLVRGLARP